MVTDEYIIISIHFQMNLKILQSIPKLNLNREVPLIKLSPIQMKKYFQNLQPKLNPTN